MRIFITGFMGSGKTSLGRALAARLGYAFVDLDEEVERLAKISVREIFECYGEERFRDLEHRCLADTMRYADVVIATGGGTPSFERNRKLLKQLGVSVWLRPSFETMMERMDRAAEQQRPLWRSAREAEVLYQSRRQHYGTADLTLPVARGERPEELAERAIELLRELPCAI